MAGFVAFCAIPALYGLHHKALRNDRAATSLNDNSWTIWRYTPTEWTALADRHFPRQDQTPRSSYWFIAVVLGMPLAMGQSKGPRWMEALCTIYIEFFRGTPVLVQLLFLYFGLPAIGLAMPGWLTALVGLGLNYAAYESQVYRAALEAIPRGQWEAAYSLGMSPTLAFRRIVLPQAFRIALPPMTNDFVSLFKDTSVAYVISVWELATAYRELANASGQFLLLGVAVSGFYLAMSLPMARIARRLERRLQNRQAVPAFAPGAPA